MGRCWRQQCGVLGVIKIMKKSLLLIALPALLVLSSCNGVNGKVNKDNFEYFKEDTVAHEDFFGGSALAPKKLGNPEENPSSEPGQFTLTPKVGVQFVSYTESAQTLYAVRYVAAVDLTSLDGITAEWTRGVSEKDGNQIKSLSGGHNSTVLYASLNNGGTPKEATSETGGEYKNYLVYSMYGIPASQVDSYIVAYLTLSKSGETDVVSKAVAAKIDGGNAFSFASDTNDYFLYDSSSQSIIPSDGSDGSYCAKYDDVVLASDANLGSFYFGANGFKYFGYDDFCDDCTDYLNESTSLEGFIAPYVDGTYDINLNKDTQKVSVTVVSRYVYFNFLPMAGGGTNGRVWNQFYCYAYKAADDSIINASWPGQEMTAVNANGLYKLSLAGNLDTVIFNNNGDQDDHMIQTSAQTYNLKKPVFGCTSKTDLTTYAIDTNPEINNESSFDYYLHTSRNSWAERTKEYGFEKTNDASQYLLRCYFNNGDKFGIKDNGSGWWSGSNLQGALNGWYNNGDVQITVDDWYNIYFKPSENAIYMSRG